MEHGFTHAALVHRAYRWALGPGGCAVAFRELVTIAAETPDVIGFGGTVTSLVIECKVSRGDFLADRKKLHRQHPQLGMGSHRVYCAPAGLLKLEELPAGWALLSVDAKGRCTLDYRRNPERPGIRFLNPHFSQPRNEQAETVVMLSALRRFRKLGLLEALYQAEPAAPELAA